MNIPVLIVAIIMALAVVAHIIGGTRQTADIAPEKDELTASWVQAMCAFQMLAVDLLAVALLLGAVLIWDMGPVEQVILRLLSLLFLLWGLVWVAQVLWLRRPSATLLRLPHWAVWFLCSGLLYAGI